MFPTAYCAASLASINPTLTSKWGPGVLTELDELILIESRARKHVAKAIQTNGKRGADMLEIYASKSEGNLCLVLSRCLEICLDEGIIDTRNEEPGEANQVERRRFVALARRMAKHEKARVLRGSGPPRRREPSVRGYEIWEYAARSIVFQAFLKIPTLRAVVMSSTLEELKLLDVDFLRTVGVYER